MTLSLILQLICLVVQVSCLAWLIGAVVRDWNPPAAVPFLGLVLGPVNLLIMLFGKVYGF